MIITRVVNETTVVLTLEGRLDSAWSEPTAVALDDAIRLGRARVELDLSAVTFISSVGIGVLDACLPTIFLFFNISRGIS